jgi:4-amino-4-deoxychorismate lyase
MSLLVETIKILNGKACNLEYHSYRYNNTRKQLFGKGLAEDLRDKLIIPAYASKGIFKCRIEYDDHIRSIDFSPYEMKKVRLLKLVEADDLIYDYKYIDRSAIEKLMELRHECDDILMVKDGRITDTSYANIIVRGDDGIWYTPSTYLLRGTKRESLLNRGLIREKEISPGSLKRYRELRLINAMIDIDDSDSIPVKTICF